MSDVTRGQKSALAQVGSGSAATTGWATNPASGSSILVAVQCVVEPDSVEDNGVSPTTFTLDAGNTNLDGAYVYRANDISLPASGDYEVTVNITGLHTIQAYGIEYIGMAPGAPDNTVTPHGTGTAVSSGSIAPDNSGGVVFGVFSDDSSLNPETVTFTGSSPQVEQARNTNGSSYSAMAVADALTGSSQTLTWTLGDSQPWAVAAASYSPDSGGPVTGTGDISVPKATLSGSGSNGDVNPTWDASGDWTLQFSDTFTSLTLDDRWQPGWFGASGITPPVNDSSPDNNSDNVTLPGDDTLHMALDDTYGALVTTNPNNSDTSTGFQISEPAAFEARIFLPGSGSTVANWPAWWLDGQNWPDDGEIDITEGLGGSTSAHVHDNFTDGPDGGGAPGIDSNTGSGWHTYGCYWKNDNTVEFFYDGSSIGSLDTDGFEGPLYLVLTYTTDTTPVPDTMKVDWVYVWTPGTPPTESFIGSGDIAVKKPTVTAGIRNAPWTNLGEIVLPSLYVQAGLSSGAPVQVSTSLRLDDATHGQIGTGTLGTSTTWSDISADVKSFTINRTMTRQQGPLWTYQAGTISILLDNSDAKYDPDNTEGPFYGQLSPLVPVRVLANFFGETYKLYSGFADGWFPAELSFVGDYAELTLSGTDAFKVLEGIILVTTSITGISDDTGTRIQDILTRADWYNSAEYVSIDTGNSTLQGTTLGESALSIMQTAVTSEIGQLYVSGGGAVVFRSRHSLLTDDRSNTVQAVFGDIPGTVHDEGIELPLASVSRAIDDTTIVNDVQASISGGTLQEAQDSDSIARYLFPRSYSSTDLILQSDSAALSWAQWVLYVGKDGENRFDEIKIDPQAGAYDLWPQVLGREIGDRIQVWHRPPGVPLPVSKDCFIVGISHEWDSTDSTWLTTWTLQDASKYGSFFTLDNPTLGQIGFNALVF